MVSLAKCEKNPAEELHLHLYFLPTVFFTQFVSANQQLGFSISGTSTLNTQSVHETSKSIIVEIHPNKAISSGKDQV